MSLSSSLEPSHCVERVVKQPRHGSVAPNLAYEAVDRHLKKGRGSNVAFRWIGKSGERRKQSYADLVAETNRFANALTAVDVNSNV